MQSLDTTFKFNPLSTVHYTTKEIEYMHRAFYEDFRLRFPRAYYKVVNVDTEATETMFGADVRRTTSVVNYLLGIDYDFDIRGRKAPDIGHILEKTNNLKLRLCRFELLKLKLTPKIGDYVQLFDNYYYVTKVDFSDIIRGSQESLATVIIIDLYKKYDI